MSNLADWINWAATQDAKGALPLFSDAATLLQSITPKALHDTPDEHGFVALTGLDPSSHWAQFRYAIKEIGDSLPDGPAKVCVLNNVSVANTWWVIMGSIVVCREVGQGSGTLNGPNIEGTFALPSVDRMGNFLNTVAAATDYFRKLANPQTGGNFPHP